MDTRPPPPHGLYTAVIHLCDKVLSKESASSGFDNYCVRRHMGIVFIGFFRNASVYNRNGVPKLGLISIIIGAIYIGVLCIAIFGTFAAITRKIIVVRIYAYLSALAVLIVAGVGLFRIVMHFIMKDDIIRACTNLSQGQTVYVYTGWWGPVYSDTLSPSEATDFCQRYWDRDTWSEIIGFLIIASLAVFFSIIAFNFLREVLDPSSSANVTRDPQRVFGYSARYNPPYNPPYGGSDYGQQHYNYPAPPVPPPHHPAAYVEPLEHVEHVEHAEYDDGKPPGYTRGEDYDGYDDSYKKKYDGEAERDVTSPRPNYPRP